MNPSLYRSGATVEREFGRLKNEYELAPVRTRRQAKVALHADLVMLARLGQALAPVRRFRWPRKRLNLG
jgi:transposase